MKNSSLGWLPYVILQCMLTTEIIIAFANVFVDPICIVQIFISLVSISFVVAFRVLMNSLCDFTWDVWSGRYADRTKCGKFGSQPVLIMLAGMLRSGRPFFVTSTDRACPSMCVLIFYFF